MNPYYFPRSPSFLFGILKFKTFCQFKLFDDGLYDSSVSVFGAERFNTCV